MDRTNGEQAAVQADDHEAGPREVELKLFVPPSSASRLWGHRLLAEDAGPTATALESRYFDTADRALAGARMALRLRLAEGRWVQTLKVAGAGERAVSSRGEWEHGVAGPRLDLALLADTPLAVLGPDLASRLRLVFTTAVTRETKRVELDGSTVEVAYDVGAIRAGRGKAERSLAINEVEIEVERGDAPDLLRFAARLAKDLPLIPLADSKAARGHRLLERRGLEAVQVELPDVASDASPRSHLAQVLAAGNAALLADAHALFEINPDDVDGKLEFVHQARIAVRRIRSALRAFEPVVHDRRVGAIAADLRSLGHVFGTARDQDVFATDTLSHIERHAATDDAARREMHDLRIVAAADRVEAHRALMRFVDAGNFGAVTIAIERLAVRLATGTGMRPTKRDRPLGDFAADWLTHQFDRIVPLARRIASLDEDARHRLRIEVKRLRYGLDLFGSLYDADALKRYRGTLSDLQDQLGKVNDAAVAARLLHAWAERAAIDVVRSRYDAWRTRKLSKQLPKVAALAVALELAAKPWAEPTPHRRAGRPSSTP